MLVSEVDPGVCQNCRAAVAGREALEEQKRSAGTALQSLSVGTAVLS